MSRRLNAVALAGLFVLGISSGTTALAQVCSQWQWPSGRLGANQSNGSAIYFNLTQSGTQLKGEAGYTLKTQKKIPLIATGHNVTFVRGSADGTLTGNAFEVTVYWSRDSIGVYRGTINPQGRIEGTTHDRMNPRSMASWFSEQTLNCQTTARETTTPSSTQTQSHNMVGPQGGLGKRRALAPGTAATCKSGFVWRVARVDDLVCVTPESRARVAEENRTAASKAQSGGVCRQGYVWREAFNGDGVCVSPAIREIVLQENRSAGSRRAQ
jgi:hypothetical protein